MGDLRFSHLITSDLPKFSIKIDMLRMICLTYIPLSEIEIDIDQSFQTFHFLFVCLFVCLFVFLFCLSNMGLKLGYLSLSVIKITMNHHMRVSPASTLIWCRLENPNVCETVAQVAHRYECSWFLFAFTSLNLLWSDADLKTHTCVRQIALDAVCFCLRSQVSIYCDLHQITADGDLKTHICVRLSYKLHTDMDTVCSDCIHKSASTVIWWRYGHSWFLSKITPFIPSRTWPDFWSQKWHVSADQNQSNSASRRACEMQWCLRGNVPPPKLKIFWKCSLKWSDLVHYFSSW